ncbi:MAG: hypothetical protein QXO67_00250 [Candidatus Bathyarchaeia archaeon]
MAAAPTFDITPLISMLMPLVMIIMVISLITSLIKEFKGAAG